MQYYMAPLEGITGYIYRNAYHRFFSPFDKYFTPFVAPTRKASLSTREKNDVLPEHNRGMNVVPQILSNNSKLFIMCARNLLQQGYTEVNLNLGCPSGTVVTKGKGAGFLGKQEELDHFLNDVFSAEDMPAISIKTRIGMEDEEEFQGIMKIFNQYPLQELIVHPRLQKDLYRGAVHMDSYEYAEQYAKAPLCYNGDIFDMDAQNRVLMRFPDVKTMMLGRGILQNPFLLETLKQSDENRLSKKTKQVSDARIIKNTSHSNEENQKRFRSFHDTILEGYLEIMPGEMPVLFKMKELWIYMSASFDFGTDKERIEKKIKKADSVSEYRSVMDTVFNYPVKG